MPPLRRESKRRPGTWPAAVVRTLAAGPRQTGAREWAPIDEPALREAWESLRDVMLAEWGSDQPVEVLKHTEARRS